MFLKHRVISGTIWNTINSAFSFIAGIGTIAVLAHLLTPDDFGMFAMISVIVNILESFSDMGVSAAIISYRDVKHQELSSLFYFNIVVGIFLALLLVLASPLIVLYYKEPRLYLYIWILSLNFIILAPTTVFNVLMRKQMQFGILAKINMMVTVVYSVAAIGYALFFPGIMSFIVATLLQSLAAAVLNIYYGCKLWKPREFLLKYTHIKRFLSFGLYQMGDRIINRFNKNIDYLLIGRFLGASALGYYSVAYTLMVKPIQRINPIITSVAFPALAELQDDDPQIKKYFLKMIRYICYIMAPIYLLFFVLSDPLIRVFYGEQWLLSVPVLAVFSFLGILYGIGNPMGNLILAKGRADIGFWDNAGKTLFLFFANFIGLRWGIFGVAVSTLTVTLCLFHPVGFFIRYYLVKMSISEYLDQIKKSLLFAFTAAGVILLLQKVFLSFAWITQLIVFSVIFLVIYVAMLAIFEKKEILYVWQSLKEYAAARKSPKE